MCGFLFKLFAHIIMFRKPNLYIYVRAWVFAYVSFFSFRLCAGQHARDSLVRRCYCYVKLGQSVWKHHRKYYWVISLSLSVSTYKNRFVRINSSNALFSLFVQGTRMEERLDDALNVLRNHCEPQIGGLGGLDGGGYVVNSPGGSLPPQDSQQELAGSVSIKLERGASTSSECDANKKRPNMVFKCLFLLFFFRKT